MISLRTTSENFFRESSSRSIKSRKKLNFENAVFEYEFKIKDKDNMLQEVKLDFSNTRNKQWKLYSSIS
ncbi:hypothetical protein ACLD43_11580 [Clostridium botulinum]|uniref:hypothetical protein n=1 Tax=Clostridium botulinum TaxID=1491 RepID=UPI003A80EB4C